MVDPGQKHDSFGTVTNFDKAEALTTLRADPIYRREPNVRASAPNHKGLRTRDALSAARRLAAPQAVRRLSTVSVYFNTNLVGTLERFQDASWPC